MTQQQTFAAGDSVRVKERRKCDWLSFEDTRQEYSVKEVLPGPVTILTLDDDSEASSEWFDVVDDEPLFAEEKGEECDITLPSTLTVQ